MLMHYRVSIINLYFGSRLISEIIYELYTSLSIKSLFIMYAIYSIAAPVLWTRISHESTKNVRNTSVSDETDRVLPINTDSRWALPNGSYDVWRNL